MLSHSVSDFFLLELKSQIGEHEQISTETEEQFAEPPSIVLKCEDKRHQHTKEVILLQVPQTYNSRTLFSE